jgi:hypothetical protein
MQTFLKHHESPDPGPIIESLGKCLGQVLDRPAVPLDLFWPAASCADLLFSSGNKQLLACVWMPDENWMRPLPAFFRMQDEVDNFPAESCRHFGLKQWHPETRLIWVVASGHFPRLAFDLQQRLDLVFEFIRVHVLFDAVQATPAVYFECLRLDHEPRDNSAVEDASPRGRVHPPLQSADKSKVIPGKINARDTDSTGITEVMVGETLPDNQGKIQEGQDIRSRLRRALSEVEPIIPFSNGGQGSG